MDKDRDGEKGQVPDVSAGSLSMITSLLEIGVMNSGNYSDVENF
jgi:hypothetical protein